MSLYDTVRANVDKAGGDERVEVNQRALIDKILARYASAGAVYRELLQNSNDAEATMAEIYFTTSSSSSSKTTIDTPKSPSLLQKPIVTQVQYRNNGMPFRPQDWSRLKKIAEGNPDESKIGAFGVGAYTMFSICEEPLVLSGNQALAFVWKGDALWTRTVDNNQSKEDQKWTSFILPSRDPYPLPDLVEFGEFLCASLTFTKSLKEIRLFVDKKQRLTIVKTQIQQPSRVEIQQSSSWWKSDGANTASPNGLFSLKDHRNSLLESFYHVQVSLDDQRASVTARYISAEAITNLPAPMVKRMERVTKKKPPKKVEVQIFLNGQQQIQNDDDAKQLKRNNKAFRIVQSFSPRIGEGRIFIGFRTSQTTGLAAHLAAPFVPTVEREAMDLQDQALSQFNLELLEFSGILMRLTLEHGMSTLGDQFSKGAPQRAKLEAELLKEETQKRQHTSTTTAEPSSNALGHQDSTDNDDDDDDQDEGDHKSSVWGFAKFMAKGVKRTIVKVVNKVEELVDDGGELMHPLDPRPLCFEESQAIILMQSFCPRQSTPDPKVGTALAQGFARCLPHRSPPVISRTGVIPGDQARLPNKGMEAFCKDDVVRSIVYQNAEEYHKVIAQCQALTLNDLSNQFTKQVLEEDMLIRFLKWWVRYSKIQPHQAMHKGLEIKECIQFFMSYKDDNSKETVPVFRLSDFLFYLDKDKIRTGSGFTVDALPMPDSVIRKTIQDAVSLRTLTDTSMTQWFEPLPMEIWIEFISHHPCMKTGQPEDEKLRLQILSTISQEYAKRSIREQDMFGRFCANVLQGKRCIPFDSNEPMAYTADCPTNLYLYSAELKAFDGIGNFHKVSERLKHYHIDDNFLIALGVRKSVAIEFLFANLDTLQWSDDPKPLVEYLRSATLTNQDMSKLRSTQYLPAENDVSRMFAPSELYLPDRDLRFFPFLRLLQWPSDDELTERSANGKFLVQLGTKVLPPLIQVLKYVALQVEDDSLRLQCLEFVSKRLGNGGTYQSEFSRMSRQDKLNLKFLPCVTTNPLDGEVKKSLYSVLTCCADKRCAVMGFPVIDPSLGNTAKLLGNLFQCVQEPVPNALIKQLMNVVNVAKNLLKNNQLGGKRAETSQRIIEAFSEMFQYLSSRSSQMPASLLKSLENECFIPCLVGGEVEWFHPNRIFFKSEKEGDDSVTESLFQSIAFSPFLSAVGVKQEASSKDIFRLMIENPQSVFAALNKSEKKYRLLLRRIAAQRPVRRVTNEIRDSPFLLAYSFTEEDGSQEKAKVDLASAQDVYIIDNSFFARMFPVKRAPHESDLEDFYAFIGSKYISKEVDKKFDIVGVAQKDTPLALSLMERIQERIPLLVSPSVTSRPLVSNAATLLDDCHLEVYEAQDLKAVYSLRKSVRSQRTTCCSQQGMFNRNSLYITSDFDWFDVGYAIGELILERCQLEDAFFISSLLEAPLDQLRARGFPVDRIIKIEPLEPDPEPKPSENGNHAQQTLPMEPSPQAGTVAKIHDEWGTDTDPKEASHASVSKSGPSDDQDAPDGFAGILKEMFPSVDDNFIRNRLGANPNLEDVRRVAEEMAMEKFNNEDSNTEDSASVGSSEKEASKLLGSKKLGRALNSFRGGGFGGSMKGSRFKQPQSTMGGSMAGPSVTQQNSDVPVPPEVDGASHDNMERMLEQTINKSSTVQPDGIASQDTTLRIPEGLDRGDACEVIPGQNLKPFTGRNEKGETHNGIKVFSARKHPVSEQFITANFDAVESFAVVLERLCGVFGMSLSSIAIFHDPTGGTIAFNANRALHFNVRFFYALHYVKNLHQNSTCYSYWFVTFAHELAHHMAPGHNKEHGFYTESYISLYLPKVLALISQVES